MRDAAPNEPELIQKELNAMGLVLEVQDRDFLAIDVPPELDQSIIDDFFISEAQSGRWGLQDGYVDERLR